MAPSPPNTSPDAPLESSKRLERRSRMRQFQADLVERMQAAREQTSEHDNRLGIVMGQSRWLLELPEVGEIVPVTAFTKVPLTKDWYLGLLNIRGNLISVIDFARFQGLLPTPVENASRIVTFSSALGINCGLLVTRVMGLRNIAPMALATGPTENVGEWVGQRYRDQESLEWSHLKLSSIMQDPRFLQIGL